METEQFYREPRRAPRDFGLCEPIKQVKTARYGTSYRAVSYMLDFHTQSGNQRPVGRFLLAYFKHSLSGSKCPRGLPEKSPVLTDGAFVIQRCNDTERFSLA